MRIETYDSDGNVIDVLDNRSLENVKEVKRAMINDFRQEVLDGGIIFAGVVYDSDEAAIRNISGTQIFIASGNTLPDGFVWRAKNNTDVPFDTASFTAFYLLSVHWVNMIYRASWYHKEQVDTIMPVLAEGETEPSAEALATAIAAVETYDFRTGVWPEEAAVIAGMVAS